MTVVLTRVDGALWVNPAPPYLTDYLQYSHRSFATEGWQRVNRYDRKQLFTASTDGGVITFQGFYEKITQLIRKQGDLYRVDDHRTQLSEPDLQAVKDINWAAVGSQGLREYQVDPVVDFLFKARENSGVINATGGFGKTLLMAATYAAFNQLNTILAIPLAQVFNDTYDKFVKLFPNKHIGKVGDGFSDISQDITITTYKSLMRCPVEKCQLLLADEVQCTTGERILEGMLKIQPIRSFGFTATDQNLFNGADKIIKGLFGERLIYIPYDEAEESGAVVPGVVYFIKMPDSIMVPATSIEGKLMHGIKRCQPRNRLVGQVCCAVPDGWQTLVFVDQIDDHLIPLFKEMPTDTRFLHRGSDRKALGDFALTPAKQKKTAKQFQENEFQYLIATDAFRAGVDIPNCRVVVQASGGTSEIEVLQEAYRGSRTLPLARQEELGVGPKTHFVLIDFMDSHDDVLENMSLKRKAIYKKQGWVIREVDRVDQIDWEVFGNHAIKSL